MGDDPVLALGLTEADLAAGSDTAEASEIEFPETVAVVPLPAPDRSTLSAAPPVAAYAGATPTSGGLAAAASLPPPAPASAGRHVAARSPELDALIARYAAHYQIPVDLLRRVVNRESTFNPAARNGPYWGLMQIRHDTARTMGYRGSAEGLLDAETNLIYAGKYLRGAYLVADGNHDMAVRHYSRGYYYHARDRGMLEVTGLGRDRQRRR